MKGTENVAAALEIAKKDLIMECRRPQEILSVLTFTLGSLLIAGLASQFGGGVSPAGIAAFLWIILFFVVILTFTTSFIREADQGTLAGLKTLPCRPVAIFAGKLVAGSILVFLSVVLIIPSILLFFPVDLGGGLPYFIIICGIGAAGLSIAGSFVSSLAMFSEGKTLLSSLLLIPVCLPEILLAVKATGGLLTGSEVSEIIPVARLMIVYILVITVIILLTFSYILEE